MADGVFQQMVKEAGLEDMIAVDSAGTGSWHVGEKAHQGTRQVLREHNIPYNGRARQVTSADMKDQSTYIIAMDDSNMNDLQRKFGHHPRLYRLLDFASQTSVKDVPDPYYTGNFEYVYQLVKDGCEGLLKMIREQEEI